jgi:general stress protein 26
MIRIAAQTHNPVQIAIPLVSRENAGADAGEAGRRPTPPMVSVLGTLRYTRRMKPQPDPIDESLLVELALGVMNAAKFPVLATIDGDQPRLRPVSPVKSEGFTVFVASLRFYGKTAEIDANPNVELCYLDANHDQVRITGVAEVVTDRAVKEDIWNTNPLLRQYLGSIDNPDLILYRIAPRRVRYMKEWALEYYEVTLTV